MLSSSSSWICTIDINILIYFYLFHDAVSRCEYTASNGKMINALERIGYGKKRCGLI
jgi:hypothetical protein